MALDAQDLRTKTADELAKMALDLRKEQMNLRFSLSGGQLENVARVRAVRRDLARVKTVAQELKSGVVAAPTKKAAPEKKAAVKKTTKTAAKKTVKDKGDA